MADTTTFQAFIINNITAPFPMDKLHRGAALIKKYIYVPIA
jgi:hypothetical protein